MDISWTWLGIVVLALIIFACASGFRRGFVKEIVSAFFMIISFLLVWVINPYVNTFVREYTPVYNIVQSNCQELVMEQTGSQKALDKEEQTQIMEKMELPDILKTSLMENNTAETYRYLAVSTFAEYIADSLAVMIVNGISFLLSFIISAIVIRLLSYILNVLTNLPVIKGVNKIAGGVVGGCGVQEYIEARRFGMARRLLRTTELPVKTVAEHCGFSGEVYFIRRFRELHGRPPGRYRIEQNS